MSETVADVAASPSKLRAFFAAAIEIVGLLVQMLLVYSGVLYLTVDESEQSEHGRLLGWCILATLYLVFAVLWLNVDLRLHGEDPPLLRRLSSSAPARWFTTIVSLTTSLIGLSAAVTLIVVRGEPDHLVLYELIAVWAMLVSWAMFQWSYARVYYAIYYRELARGRAAPLIFPGTAPQPGADRQPGTAPQPGADRPRIVDFVYFAFTNSTSFAPGDVAVATTRMRWTVVWHTTLSFFFNALILVLTMNTIAGGFADL